MGDHLLYAYGTLRQADQAATHLVPGRMYDLGWYPGAVLLKPDAGMFFYAERMVVDAKRLAELDDYEGYDPKNPDGSLFRRVPYLDGEIYVYNHDTTGCRMIDSGDWLMYCAARTRVDVIGHNSYPEPVLIEDFLSGHDEWLGNEERA